MVDFPNFLSLFCLRYESVVLGNGLANQVSNPHVEVDITKPDVMIRKQIAVLREMTTWLKAAHSGIDITFDGGKKSPFHGISPIYIFYYEVKLYFLFY